MMDTLARWIALIVFALVVAGGAALEIASGVWPGSGISGSEDRVSPYAVRSGLLAKAVERDLESRSAVRKWSLPYLSELMYRLFREVTPKVVLGEDDWLFFAQTVVDYPSQEELSQLPATARALAAAIAALEKRGARVHVLIVPNKASVCFEHLGRSGRRFHPVYPEVLDAFASAGVDLLDVRKCLAEDEPPYTPNDTHWTAATALRVAEELAHRIRDQFDGEPPGTPVAGEVQVRDPMLHRGDLAKMLGFREEGSLAERFSVPRRDIVGVRAGTTVRLGVEHPEPVFLSGTSFSNSVFLASLLSASLDREVEYRAGVGLPAWFGVTGVLRDVLLGVRPLPRVIVWEFPERYLFRTYLPLQQALLNLRHALEYRREGERLLEFESRDFIGIEPLEESPRLLVADASYGGRIVYRLGEPLPGDGSVALVYVVTTKGFGRTGASLIPEGETAAVPCGWAELQGRNEPTLVVLPVVTPRRNPVQQVIIEPTRDQQQVRLSPVGIWHR